MPNFKRALPSILLALASVAGSSFAFAAPDEALQAAIKKEKEPYLETLKSLVNIESGSGDREGLDKISTLIHDRLVALGGRTEFIEAGDDVYKMFDTPKRIGRMVRSTFVGKGSKKILLIAHMDTVYLKGMLAQQPFQIKKFPASEGGDRAYGLGIADDKHGVALILHVVKLLQERGMRDYAQLTVLINGDEEISSPASRNLLTKLGAEHDVTLSCEGASALPNGDALSLTTAGIGAVTLNVSGKASHAGAAPELGRNALYELSHQILQMRDLSDPNTGVKFNWTVSQAGTNRNVIPAQATASADIRVLRVADFDGIEPKVAARIKNQLIPDTKVVFNFERRRPPLQISDASLRLAKHAKTLYKDELGRDLVLRETAVGGGTDAAFAALKTSLYLMSKLITDISQGKTD